MALELSSWLLSEAQVRKRLGFKNSNTFKKIAESLGLVALKGKDGRVRYTAGDVERCIERHFTKAQQEEVNNGQGN